MIVVSHWLRGNSITVDGAEFHAKNRELGHINLDGAIQPLLTGQL